GEPGGGGGTVFCFRRAASRATWLGPDASRRIASGAGGDSPSTVQPDANSAMRPFVSSPRRRGFRSSSGTPARRYHAPASHPAILVEDPPKPMKLTWAANDVDIGRGRS